MLIIYCFSLFIDSLYLRNHYSLTPLYLIICCFETTDNYVYDYGHEYEELTLNNNVDILLGIKQNLISYIILHVAIDAEKNYYLALVLTFVPANESISVKGVPLN